MHLHLNPIGGLAGDMFCAALLDLAPALLPELRAVIAALNPPPGLDVDLETAPGHLHGRRFRVRLPETASPAHHHTHYSHIRTLLDAAPLPLKVRDQSQAIFRRLAEAEAFVHGVEPDAVSFHEVGNWDSIVDIVGAAFLLDRLKIRTLSTEPLPRGGGRVHSEHGWLPVPAPATAKLLEGLPLFDDGVAGERITPTGAAILRALTPGLNSAPAGRLQGTGYGFGTRRLDGIPNCVQAQLLETEAPPQGYRQADSVLEILFEADDQSAEDLAAGLERIRAQDGVLSVISLAALGKAGRLVQQVQILGRPEAQEALFDHCFRETATIGLRYRETRRWVLRRREARVEVGGRMLGVKVCERPDGPTAKAENRDLKGVAGHAERRRLAQMAETSILQQNRDDETA